jgi:HD-like signal output (HDOD) protein
MSSIDSFLDSVTLPPINEVTRELIQSLNRESIPIYQVSAILGKDPALTVNILRIANSAQSGLPRGVGTLDEAIALVGMSRVRALALGASMAGAFPHLPGLDRQTFWRSSMYCAGYAQWLAECVGIDGQIAWLTGVMLRLGEILIGQAEPKTLLAIEELPLKPGERWQRERQLVGFTEGQITAELARRWNFPMQMVQALERSANPLLEQAFSRLGSVLHLASLLSDVPSNETDPLEVLPLEVIDSLRLDLDWLNATLPTRESFAELALA